MKKSMVVLLLLTLTASVSGCITAVPIETIPIDTDAEVTENDITNTAFSAASVLMGELDSLPGDFESALLFGAPVGGTPRYFVFEQGLTYYRVIPSEEKYHKFALSLPDGNSDGKIIFIGSGAGSGEVMMVVEAQNNGKTVYYECVFYPDYYVDPTGNLIFMGGRQITADDAEMYRAFANISKDTLRNNAGNTNENTVEESLYEKTAAYLEREFHRVYDPHYDIQALTISNWSENKNEATFNYNMTFLYYNRDPDTVEYIMNAKQEDPERYEMMYNDYLALKQVNYQFKIVPMEDELELYFNVSPTGTEWVKTTVDDFILTADNPSIKSAELTATYPCAKDGVQNKTDTLILNYHSTSTILYSEHISLDNDNMLTAYAVQNNETLIYYQVCYLFDAEKDLLYEYVLEIGDLEALRKTSSSNTLIDYFSNTVFEEASLYRE